MDVLGAMTDYGEDVWYSESLMITLRTHIPILINQGRYSLHSVNQKEAYVYAGNLYSYLSMKGVQKRFHYAILVANRLNSPIEFDVGIFNLLIPDLEEVERIKEIHVTH